MPMISIEIMKIIDERETQKKKKKTQDGKKIRGEGTEAIVKG